VTIESDDFKPWNEDERVYFYCHVTTVWLDMVMRWKAMLARPTQVFYCSNGTEHGSLMVNKTPDATYASFLVNFIQECKRETRRHTGHPKTPMNLLVSYVNRKRCFYYLSFELYLVPSDMEELDLILASLLSEDIGVALERGLSRID
jgi:hypothetical protein